MAAFIIFMCAIAGLLTFILVGLSISLIFWLVNDSKDKQRVFKLYFPYYIITLVGFAICLISLTDFDAFVSICFGIVYIMALLIWRSELKSSRKENKNFAVEPNQSRLP